MTREVRPGEVWQVSFDPVVGHEQGGTRPVLIVSGDQFSALPHGHCVVAPITSRLRDIPTQVPVHPPEGGLGSASVVMCDQLRTISRDRLRYRRGDVEPATMIAVRMVIGRVFAI